MSESLHAPSPTTREFNERQYSSPANLRLRREPYKYAEFPFDYQTIILGSLGLKGDESLLDAGCGDGIELMDAIAASTTSGQDLSGLQVFGLDLVWGELVSHQFVSE